jgi:hypothetical protein
MILLLDIKQLKDIMFFIQWDGMRFDFQLKIMLSKQELILESPQIKILLILKNKSKHFDLDMIGIVKLILPIQSIINGHSGFFLSFLKKVLHTNKTFRLTIAQAVRQVLQMKRFSMTLPVSDVEPK